MGSRREAFARQGRRGMGGNPHSGLVPHSATKACRRKCPRPSGLRRHGTLGCVVFGRPSPLRGLACLNALPKVRGARNATSSIYEIAPSVQCMKRIRHLQIKRRKVLACIAEELALKPLHGAIMGMRSNIGDVISHFGGPVAEYNYKWCAAFVYHCCHLAGFTMPRKYTRDVRGSFADVHVWLQWAKSPENRFYWSARARSCCPERGDIVVFDNAFEPGAHDHIGIVLRVNRTKIKTAEGNVNNLSLALWRKRDRHVRGFIRIPNDWSPTT